MYVVDVFKFINGGREQFDFIFADPPYELKELGNPAGADIQEQPSERRRVYFVLEHGKQNNFEDHPHFVERRVYGSVNFSFFR